MSLKIRMARRGTTNRPFYHIVATDSRSPRDGNYLEKLGTYNPLAQSDKAVLETERVKYWLGVGAQPSERVAKILGQLGVTPATKISERPGKSAPKKRSQERATARAEKEAALEEARNKPAEAPVAEEAPAAEETASEASAAEETTEA